MEYIMYAYQAFILPLLESTSSIPIPKNAERKGRKSLNSTIILSEFFCKSKKYPPRREYIRCCLFRKMFKFIRTVNKSPSECSHPYYLELVRLITENSNQIKALTSRERLPFVENKTNTKFKSYNNKFCKQFLANELIKKVFVFYVEFIFATYSLEEICKALGIYCCKGQCENEVICRLRFEKIKVLMLVEILS